MADTFGEKLSHQCDSRKTQHTNLWRDFSAGGRYGGNGALSLNADENTEK